MRRASAATQVMFFYTSHKVGKAFTNSVARLSTKVNRWMNCFGFCYNLRLIPEILLNFYQKSIHFLCLIGRRKMEDLVRIGMKINVKTLYIFIFFI